MARLPSTPTATRKSSSCSFFFIAAVLFLLSLAATRQCQAARVDYRLMDRMLKQLETCSKFQALGVAVVEPDGTHYEQGKENNRLMHKPAPRQAVGKDTAFCLGGGTQAFTSVLLSMLLDKHDNHTMDTPLHEVLGSHYHLPGRFRTRRINLKDVLAMRSGLSNMDIVALANGMNRYRLMQNLRFAPEISPFREENVYSEVLYSLAEDAARALGGETWYKLMRQHIFTPLGMEGAGFVHTDGQTDTQVARPYLLFRDEHHQIPWEAYKGQEVVAAATSVCASPSDMAKWMHFILTGGKTRDHRQLVKEETIRSTFQGVQYRRDGDNPRTSGFRPPTVDERYSRDSNALGWIRGSYRGQSFVSQDGSLPGYESLVTILTGGQGAVFTAFTGVAGSKAFAIKSLVNMFALDLLLKGNSDIEVCSVLRKMTKATEDAEPVTRSHNPRAKSDDKLFHPAEEYEGSYRNYAFGDLTVRRNNTGGAGQLRLELQYGELGTYVLHQSDQNDTFMMQARGPLKYRTDMDDYRNQGPYLAIFGNRYNDPSRRIETVTIPHFARDTDPEFSKNPVPPRTDHYEDDDHCNAPPTASAVSGVLAAASLMVVTTVGWLQRAVA